MSEHTRADQVRHLAERLATLLNDCADAGVHVAGTHISGRPYMLSAAGDHRGWHDRVMVHYDDEGEHWKVEEAP